jgi:hypothetical protein
MSVDNKSHTEIWLTARAAYLLFFLAGSAAAAPLITQTSGTFNHKAIVTIDGSGFGSKATAAPVVWDDASTGSFVTDNGKWDGAVPNNNPAYNTVYRTQMRGIGLPHNHITRYIAGAHGDSAGFNAGYDVMFWKNRTISSYPAYTYVSWYQRADDAWVFGGDNNFKTFDYSAGSSPYTVPNWYIEYNDRPSSTSSIPQWHANMLPDGDTSNWWWNNAVNPMSGVWTKIEMEIKYTNQNNGYIKIWENGVQKSNYVGTTDNFSGSLRNESIGGYARIYGQPNNWRYFADVYLDYTPARVVLANNSNLSNATIIESQIPSSWSNNSIAFSVNLGKFTTGQSAYLFVVDSTGARNATGIPVTVGGAGGGGVPVLDPPTNLRAM